MNLGVHEAKDVLQAIKYLNSLCFVDSSRIALWGWSYGGFLSSMVAGEGVNVVSTVVSVAPVTDWRLYDSIYTERYMRTPQQNGPGYNASSVLLRAAKFDVDYMLIHGTADDNVHFQNGALLANQLVLNNIQFSTMFYTNRDHSLRNPVTQATNEHLYRLMTDFLLRSFQLSDLEKVTSRLHDHL